MEPLDPVDQLLRGRPADPWWSVLRERLPPAIAERWPWVAAIAVIGLVTVVVIVVGSPASAPPLELPRAAASPAGSTAAPPGSPSSAASPGSPGSSGSGSGSAPGSSVVGSVIAHVAGAVVRPGLVTLPTGARVADAVAAAGGLRPDAEVDRLNLAAPVSDGVRVFVPVAGQSEPSVVGPVGTTPGGTGAGTTPAGPVDLNSATAEQLDALPGVGPSTAAAILAYRAEHHGFGSVDELQDVRGIGPAKFDTLRDLVTVGR